MMRYFFGGKHFLYLFSVLLMVFAATEFSYAQSAAVLECDRLASSIYDTGRSKGISGIAYGDIDAAKAIVACEAAANEAPNEIRMTFNLARALEKAGRSDEAAVYYTTAVEAGHPLAMVNLGVMYENGQGGLAQDSKKAFDLYKKAADAGSVVAINNLASSYENGLGVGVDKKQALGLYEKAARGNFKNAQQAVARMYEAGDGLPAPDLEKAAVFLRLLAQGGDNEARLHLAELIEAKKVGSYPGERIAVLEAAAASDSRAALYILAKHYRGNMAAADIPRNLDKAYEYASRALKISEDAGDNAEDGWLPNQEDAASLMLGMIDKDGMKPTDPSIIGRLRDDFGAGNTKRVTVKINCGGQQVDFYMYLWDWKRDYPQTDSQVAWLKNVRGCDTPADVVESFRKLYKIAHENKVSFAELVMYSLGDANKNKPRTPAVLRRGDAAKGEDAAGYYFNEKYTLDNVTKIDFEVTCNEKPLRKTFYAYLRDEKYDSADIKESIYDSLLDGSDCKYSPEEKNIVIRQVEYFENYREDYFGNIYVAIKLMNGGGVPDKGQLVPVVLADECSSRMHEFINKSIEDFSGDKIFEAQNRKLEAEYAKDFIENIADYEDRGGFYYSQITVEDFNGYMPFVKRALNYYTIGLNRVYAKCVGDGFRNDTPVRVTLAHEAALITELTLEKAPHEKQKKFGRWVTFSSMGGFFAGTGSLKSGQYEENSVSLMYFCDSLMKQATLLVGYSTPTERKVVSLDTGAEQIIVSQSELTNNTSDQDASYPLFDGDGNSLIKTVRGSKKLKLTFDDGSAVEFSAKGSKAAMEAAERSCNANIKR